MRPANRVQEHATLSERPRPLVSRERLARLAAILERRIAERAVMPATLDVLARARALLSGKVGQ